MASKADAPDADLHAVTLREKAGILGDGDSLSGHQVEEEGEEPEGSMKWGEGCSVHACVESVACVGKGER